MLADTIIVNNMNVHFIELGGGHSAEGRSHHVQHLASGADNRHTITRLATQITGAMERAYFLSLNLSLISAAASTPTGPEPPSTMLLALRMLRWISLMAALRASIVR